MALNYKTDLNRYRKYYQAIEPILKKTSSRANISIIFSFLAVSLFAWYAIRPTIQTILYLRREIADNTVINKQMEEKISALIEAQAYYQEIEPILPNIDLAMPQNPDAVPLVMQLRNLASASGVILTSLQPASTPLLGKEPNKNPKTTTSPLVSVTQQTYDVILSVQGSFDNIRSYLDGIINMKRIVTISGMALSPIQIEQSSSPSATLSDSMLQLALRLKTYYLVE
jgi:Tfp pilus assembly protein PilO